IRVPGRIGPSRTDLANVLAGDYVARVRSVNALGVSSLWAYSELTEIDGPLEAPPLVTSLTATGIVFGIRLEWGFPNTPNIIEKTEIYYSASNDFGTATKLGDFAYPQDSHTLAGLSAGQTFYFWAILVDKNGLSGTRYPNTTAGVM